jgi:hypothetical protein
MGLSASTPSACALLVRLVLPDITAGSAHVKEETAALEDAGAGERGPPHEPAR